MNNSDIKILIVDDEPNSTQILGKVLSKKGYTIKELNDSVAAKKLIGEKFFNIIISDLQMPNISGLELLIVKPEKTLFIMITGYGSINSAVDSMKNGAFDYVNKPFNIEEFVLKVEKAVEKIKLENQVEKLKNLIDGQTTFHNIIGKSKKMIQVFELIKNVAVVSVNILVYGESGTVKELVAKAIHNSSSRKDFPFVAINCSAIPENLLESELFGHVKGAFTGAIESQKGVFEQADGGTLFLDEIGDMPYTLQAKLLRVLETWEIKPLGGEKEKKVDIRLISATNKDLNELIAEKRFREDLFYRIATVTVSLPSLNERREDIPLLVNNYLHRLFSKFGKEFSITPEAIDALINKEWKGNVRELENVLEQAAITTTSEVIGLDNLSFGFGHRREGVVNFEVPSPNRTLKEIEKEHIARVLKQVNGNKVKASEILQIDRKTLYKKISDYNL